MFRFLLITILIALTVPASSPHAEMAPLTGRRITFDGNKPTIVPPSEPEMTRGVGPKIIDDQNQVISTTFDKGTPYSLKIEKLGPDRGSLAFAIGSQPPAEAGQSEKSKIEINVIRQDDIRSADGFKHSMMQNYERSVLTFKIKFDPSYEVPTRWVAHFQVFQCCGFEPKNPIVRMQPPLIWVVEPNCGDDVHICTNVMIRNREFITASARYDNGIKLQPIDGSQNFGFTKGQWYQISFDMRPNPDVDGSERGQKAGYIGLTVDGKLAGEYRGAWGYGADLLQSNQGYALKVGIYRAAQPRKQEIQVRDIFWKETQAR